LRKKPLPDFLNPTSTTMKIGIDVMGGDFAPDAIIEGAVDSLQNFSGNDKLVLIGKSD